MNQKRFINVILIMIAVVLAGAAGYFSLVNKPAIQTKQAQPADIESSSSEQKPLVVEKISAQALPQDESTIWKTYRNDKLGLAFNYPADWGEVTVERGNETSIEVPPCEGIVGKGPVDKLYPWGLYNASIKFSKAPIDFEIKLLDLNTPGIMKVVCSSAGESITLSNIQPKTQKDEVLVTNKAGIEFMLDSSLFDWDIAVDGPIYITRRDNKLVWIYSGYAPYAYTPEATELNEKYSYPCENNSPKPRKGCGAVDFLQTGETSGKARQGFNDIKELVQSFVFIP